MDNELKASWDRLCDGLKQSADYVFDPARGADASEQAEGLRHHLRMLFWAYDRIVENNDPEHPELGWVYPFKVGQDNPDAMYMTAPVDLSHTYRLTGRIDTLRYLGLSLMDHRFRARAHHPTPRCRQPRPHRHRRWPHRRGDQPQPRPRRPPW